MRRALGILAGTLAVLGLVVPPASASTLVDPYASGSTGIDVSYPNCTTTLPTTSFRIVGVTDGAGWSENPCLAAEAAHVSNLSLYVNTGWYDQSTHLDATSPLDCATVSTMPYADCLAYNYGWNAGAYAKAYADSLGVTSATWWLDVETGNTWNADTAQNRESLQGEYDVLTQNGGATTVGVYSTTSMWDSITGTWKNGWPSWGATTWTTAAGAASYCTGHEFTGGPSLLMQYKAHKSRVDQDVAC